MQWRLKRLQVKAKSPFMLVIRGIAANRYAMARIPPTPNAIPTKKLKIKFVWMFIKSSMCYNLAAKEEYIGFPNSCPEM
jgi:hypothetical protein